MGFCKDGANVILRDYKYDILVARQNYDEGKLILPGGGVEPGETFRNAAVREVLEETGITVCESRLTLAGDFGQRVKDYSTGLIHEGRLQLFEAADVFNIRNFQPNDEISEVMFMAEEEIIARMGEFKIGYVRMVIHYGRYKSSGLPVVGRLSEKVELSYFPQST